MNKRRGHLTASEVESYRLTLPLPPAPARGSQSGGARGSSERADSAAPALARGVSSVSSGAPETVRFARFEPELQNAPGLAMPRSAMRWYSFLPRTMRADEPPSPPQAPSEPLLEPRASPPSRRATAPGVDLAPKIPVAGNVFLQNLGTSQKRRSVSVGIRDALFPPLPSQK